MKTTIYGIKNCDTMKKAFTWLDDRKIDYEFRNYKKDGVDLAILKSAMEEFGWETIINRNGTTWRGLPESAKADMSIAKALKLAEENPSIVKRPILVRLGQYVIGFDPKAYEELF